MAKFKAVKSPDPIKIDKWLGVNESIGLTEISPGEAIRQINFRITKDYKPQKREGHKTFVDFGNTSNVQGMWHGMLNNIETWISCNGGHVYRDKSISGTVYDSLDTSTYTNVDVVKTTALPGSEAGSTSIENVVILYDSSSLKMTEVALANVDNVASVGKFYFDADEKINYIVTKDAYADIAAARTGLGTTTAYYRIGAITDAKTSIIYFESKLLFFNGTDFKEYDGTTYQDVVVYIPTVFIASPPAGGGTAYEPINLLTGRKKQEFQGDGTATAYQLTELAIDAALVTCTVNGVAKTETTDFTVNRTTGVVTFTVAPANESLVILEWTKVVSGHADLVKKNRFAMTFGPGNDTAIFVWGNTAAKNRRSWCGTLNAGYWPVTNFTLVGSNEFAITDIKTQNANYQMIFKEDRTHYSYAEYVSTTDSWDYPVKDLNEKVGNVTYDGVQIINDTAISIKGKTWWQWTTSSVESQRSAVPISERLKNSLAAIDLTTAVTFDYQSEKEYWCNVGSTVYIWNYGNNTMYTFDNISGTCFIDINGVVYYGSQGKIERMEGLDDNGIIITAQLDTGFNSFGSMHMVKTSDSVYIGLLPDSQTSVTIYFKTNKINEFKKINKVVEYRLLDWNNIDFNNYTFITNRNPQTFGRNMNSREYTFIQFRFENASLNETCVLLDFYINSESQGEVL